MKRMTFAKQVSAAMVFGALAVSSVHAQDTTESLIDSGAALIQGWSGSATLGANTATGNAESSNISGSIDLGKRVGEKWEHRVFGKVFKGTSTIVVPEFEDDGITPALDPITNQPLRRIVKGNNSDRIELGYKPHYYWRPRTYLFGILDYEQDKPAGIESGTRQLVGIGHKFYANESGFFSAEAGFGNKVTEGVTDDGDSSGAIGYLGLKYRNVLTENVTLNAGLDTDIGGDNTAYEASLGLNFALSERLSLSVEHFTRGNTDLEDLTNPLNSGTDSVTDFKLVFSI